MLRLAVQEKTFLKADVILFSGKNNPCTNTRHLSCFCEFIVSLLMSNRQKYAIQIPSKQNPDSTTAMIGNYSMVKSDGQFGYVHWKDLKNIEDQTVYSFGMIVQKMRSEITNLINTVGEQASFKPLTQSNFVSLKVLFRLKECMVSIELLISKGLARDAAQLLLTLMELRLEMQYVSENSSHASDWIACSRQNKKPWTVDFLIKNLFPNDEDRHTERSNYKHLLQIKHSDPMGSQPSFPVKDDDFIHTDQKDLAVCLFCEGSECYRTLIAASEDLSESGFNISKNRKAIEDLNELKEKLQSLRKCKTGAAQGF